MVRTAHIIVSIVLAFSFGVRTASAQPNTLSAQSPFVLAFENRPTIGTVATPDQICEVLRHPFLTRDVKLFRFTDWDPRDLSSGWIRNYFNSLHRNNLFVSKNTAAETDTNLRKCLQQLSTQDKRIVSATERLLDLSVSTCVFPVRKATEQLTPSGQDVKGETSILFRCANWDVVWEQPFPKRIAFLLMLTVREANVALHSILDTAEAAAVAFEANRMVLRQKGEEYAKLNETKWSSNTAKDVFSDQTITTSVSVQETNGAVAELKVRCVNDTIKVSALIVDRDGKPTIAVPRSPTLFGQQAIKGQLRINDEQALETYFAQGAFRNEFYLDVDSQAVVAGLHWRIYAAVQTSAGQLLIKVPLFDTQIRTTINSCKG